MIRIVVAALLTLSFAGAASATPALLTLTSNPGDPVINTLLDGIDPEGLAFGVDATGAPEIFVGDKISNKIFVYTDPGSTGNYSIDRSFFAPFGKIRSLDILPNGNLLTANDSAVEEISSVNGAVVAGGISFSNFSFSEIEAAIFVNSGSIFLGGETNDQIIEVDSLGVFQSSFLHGDLNQNGTIDFNSNPVLNEQNLNEVSAGAYDPINDILYIADDSSGSGQSRIWAYERSTGTLLAVSDPMVTLFGWGTGATNDPSIPDEPVLAACIANTNLPCFDPEGLAIGIIGGVPHLLFAFENEQVVTAVTFAAVPEPGTALLLVLGVVGLAAYAPRRGRS